MPIHLDDTDYQILEALQEDASLATGAIATRVGLSMSPCWRRIRRLEDLGVITSRVALLDRDKLGFEVVSMQMRKGAPGLLKVSGQSTPPNSSRSTASRFAFGSSKTKNRGSP